MLLQQQLMIEYGVVAAGCDKVGRGGTDDLVHKGRGLEAQHFTAADGCGLWRALTGDAIHDHEALPCDIICGACGRTCT